MNNKSFTLIELLVVIVIIGILAGVIMVSTSSSIDKANITKGKVFSESVKNNLMLNLISEWKFDGPTQIGSVATVEDVKDSWGSNHGSVSGNVLVKGDQDCVSKKCLDLNGAYVSFGNSDALKRITRELTVSYWVYVNQAPSSSYAHIFSKGYAPSAGNSWTAGLTSSRSGYFFVRYGDNSAYSHTPAWGSISLKKWFFYTHVFKGSSFVATYKDGLLDGGINNTISFSDIYESAANVQMGGGSSSDRYFYGLIDEVKIYDAALTSSQIKQNYIAGLDSLLSNGNISKEDYNRRINELAYEK